MIVNGRGKEWRGRCKFCWWWVMRAISPTITLSCTSIYFFPTYSPDFLNSWVRKGTICQDFYCSSREIQQSCAFDGALSPLESVGFSIQISPLHWSSSSSPFAPTITVSTIPSPETEEKQVKYNKGLFYFGRSSPTSSHLLGLGSMPHNICWLKE